MVSKGREAATSLNWAASLHLGLRRAGAIKECLLHCLPADISGPVTLLLPEGVAPVNASLPVTVPSFIRHLVLLEPLPSVSSGARHNMN